MTSGDAFDALQRRLGTALDANAPGSTVDHVLVVLPSFSVSESLLSHYGNRIASLEHRYLNALLIAGRLPTCEMLTVLTRQPDPSVIEYYVGLMPADMRDSARARIGFVEVDDGTPRSVAAKLLQRPDLIDDIRARVRGRPALIEPWNVTEHEVGLALALGIPINGSNPRLRGLGFKSAGRRLMRDAGVPVPWGVEDVRSVDDVVAAIEAITDRRPDAPGVVVKHDDSGAGDGNAVIDLHDMPPGDRRSSWLRERVEALPGWYLADLERGGIVEERISGERFSSPSAQVDIRPGGAVVVLATHEQELGGESGQVYLGCRFPADPAYAIDLARHAEAVGRALARAGALGRFSIDFVAASEAGGGSWRVYGLEVNLRKGGTTHPYAALRNAVPGSYRADLGRWVTDRGENRTYVATDNLVDASWTALTPLDAIRAVGDAGLQFDPDTGVGVILHMLSGLAIDGRLGCTAIAEDTDAAQRMRERVSVAIDEHVARRRVETGAPARSGGTEPRRVGEA